LAAGLAELTAAVAGDRQTAKAARELVAVAEDLARQDAAAYAELLRTGSEEARQQTIEVPTRIAELAAEAAGLASSAAVDCSGPARYDALAGVIIAAAAARMAVLVVAANCGDEADERVSRARAALERTEVFANRISER
jgi:formiminotetrahydrofolate cyclodeaminase